MTTLIVLGVIAFIIYKGYSNYKAEQERQYQEAVRAALIIAKARIEQIIKDYNYKLRQAVIAEVGGHARFNQLKSNRNPKYDSELQENAHILMSYFVVGATYCYMEPLLDRRLGYGFSDDSWSSVMFVHQIYEQGFRHRRNNFFTNVDPSVIYELRDSAAFIEMVKTHTHLLHGVYGISKYDLAALCFLFAFEISLHLTQMNPEFEHEIHNHVSQAMSNLQRALGLNLDEIELVTKQARQRTMACPEDVYDPQNILEDDVACVLVKHKAELFTDANVHLLAQLAHLNDAVKTLDQDLERIKKESSKN